MNRIGKLTMVLINSGIIGLLVTAFLLPTGIVQAAEDIPQGRIVNHISKTQVMDVGSYVEGHILGVSQGFGMFFAPDGDVANTVFTLTFDTINGTGTAQGYQVEIYLDGSRNLIAWQGIVTADESGKSWYDGQWECLGGTGRHEGTIGGGTYSGESMKAGLDPGSILYLKIAGICKKP